MSAAAVAETIVVDPMVNGESAETIIAKVRKYLESRRPFDSVPASDEEFFACALARLTWQPSTVLTAESIELGRRDHKHWQQTGELPYYILQWRDLARQDIMHFIG
ncbi:MAG: hypothetical protein Q8O19_06405 [Rectinemataceae bacterium]|nr:hypothetical protein [Rectinemataceae bacterium]